MPALIWTGELREPQLGLEGGLGSFKARRDEDVRVIRSREADRTVVAFMFLRLR